MTKYLAGALLTVIGLQGALMIFLDRYGQRDRAVEAKGVQAIIILGAGIREGGEMGPSLRARSRRALELYHSESASKLIATGGLGTWPPEESVAVANWLEAQGVPSADILTERKSTSTRENLQNAAELCRARGWKRVIVVSDPYHLWRAERNARALGLNAFVSPSENQPVSTRLWMTWRETFAVLRDLLT